MNIKLIEWNQNKLIDPYTNKKIKSRSKKYNNFKKLYNNYISKRDYIKYRNKKIDPILLEKLPIFDTNIDDIFKYPYIWNPYNGLTEYKIDKSGPLCFDTLSLVNYFYINRLKKLWVNGFYEDDYYINGYYDDAVGNYPYFYINSRGYNLDWYLFKLPITDCYSDNNNIVTISPDLSDNDIHFIYTKSLKYKDLFKRLYNYELPNLIKIKELYDKAVGKIKNNDILDIDLCHNSVDYLLVI